MHKFILLAAILGVAIKATPSKQLSSNEENINDKRIVGGDDTTIESIPHQISLHLYSRHFCGGSIISNEWIITAARCVKYSIELYTIRAGSSYHNHGGSIHKIKEIIKFVNSTNKAHAYSNNIALIRVDVPFKFDKTRQPIVISDENEDPAPGLIVIVSGWGLGDYGYPNNLQRVEVPIVSTEKCGEIYSEFGDVIENEICAGYPEGGKDTCYGDEGGPLTIDGRLAGITSWRLGCALAGYPAVYTEVSVYRSWIKRMINI